MFDFDRPLGHDEDRGRQMVAGFGALVVSLVAMWMAPTPAGRLGALKRDGLRFLIEWGPVMVLALAARLKASTPATAVALLVAIAGAIATQTTGQVAFCVAGALAGAYVFLSVKVADQWERCPVLRFGRYHAVRGPGIFHVIPIVDRVAAYVDQRVQTTAVWAEAALTRDAVPAHVDAVVFWLVSDVERAIFEVQDFDRTVALAAQTALLESIGRYLLADLIADRAPLGRELQRMLEEKTTPWGITVQSVEIRDVRLPRDLQDVLSRGAQAERERQARIILGSSEIDLADRFAQASAAYRDDPTALHLRAMNMLYEVIKEKGRMVVVPVSSLRRRARWRRS